VLLVLTQLLLDLLVQQDLLVLLEKVAVAVEAASENYFI
jgi:hypothetical protein